MSVCRWIDGSKMVRGQSEMVRDEEAVLDTKSEERKKRKIEKSS